MSLLGQQRRINAWRTIQILKSYSTFQDFIIFQWLTLLTGVNLLGDSATVAHLCLFSFPCSHFSSPYISIT